MTAILALGEGAVVSHQSAAAVWGMLKPTGGPIHVTLPGDGGRKRRRGIEIHPSHSLIDGVTTRRNGIAITKPARTLRDRVLRFTYRLCGEPSPKVAATLRRFLGQSPLEPNL
jgi:hypothetical protein